MNVATRIVNLLEEYGVEYVFGLPGEQILPLYKALKDSSIKHILMRHEQAAAHAADAYYRSSLNLGVCISTASPGALNLVMAVATAYKDNIPLLVLTGDNPTTTKKTDSFQSFPLSKVFKNITFKNYDPSSANEAIANLKEGLAILNHEPKGPIHINLSNDILKERVSKEEDFDFNLECFDYTNLDKAYDFIRNSKRPFLILGGGSLNKKTIYIINKLVVSNSIPIATTFPAKGIVSEFKDVNLGLIGNRGGFQSKYALENSDCIIALGTRLSERTIKELNLINDRLIHINIDKSKLRGFCPIHGDINVFLDNVEFNNYTDWLDEILSLNYDEVEVTGVFDESVPLKPQSAINSILTHFENNIIVSDAGSHTTWTTLLKKSNRFGKLIFSGALASMGYGLPGSVGAAFGNPNEKIILINGDGDFQMNIQELATISQYSLPVIICILNNHEYGIIRQYEEDNYNMESYQVALDNPDFVKIADAYNIKSKRVNSKKDLEILLKKLEKFNEPFLIEIIVSRENIPLPKNSK